MVVYRKKIQEDAPVNNVGGGNIAGIGVGPKGEPGVSKAVKPKILRRKEAEASMHNTEVRTWRRKAINELAGKGRLDAIVRKAAENKNRPKFDKAKGLLKKRNHDKELRDWVNPFAKAQSTGNRSVRNDY